jgi:hypothetical protein
LTIFLGNGDGTFTQSQALSLIGYPDGIAAADLNGDGKLDLVVTDSATETTTPQTVEVFLGLGDGTFQTPSALITVGPDPEDVVLADFNGDGKLDLAVSVYVNGVIAILSGNGDGTFGAPAIFATDNGPTRLVAADLNADGKMDLVSVNEGAGSMSVLLGHGDGTFATANTLLSGSDPLDAVVGDFNGDGKLDIAVTNGFANAVVVLLGVGDGTLHAPLSVATGAYPAGVGAGDFNRDGKLDLVTANYSANTTSVLLNTTALPSVASLTAQAGTPQSSAVNAPYSTPFAVLARDAASNPLPGALITFNAPLTGASGIFGANGETVQRSTGVNGVATAPSFIANAVSGSFAVTAGAGAASAIFSLTNTGAGSQPPAFTSASAPNGAVNTAYSYTLTASGTPAPTFSVLPNALPTGLSLNGSSGLINGTPSAAGTFAGMFTAANGVPPNATQNFAITISGFGQTITFGALGNKTYGAQPFAVSATASSGLTVSFASLTTSVCTVSGTTVTIVAVGACSIQASQAGNASYGPAPNVNQSFTVTQASQTITFGTISSKAYGTAPFTASATASSGLAVSFASLTTSVCTVSGSTVTLVAVGTCTIQAAQAGNANYSAAPNVTQGFSVTQGSQTITFGALANQTYGWPPFAVSATASSGLTVSFVSLTVSVCTVSGSTVTLVAGGVCTVQAQQAGNVNWAPAPSVSQSLTIAPGFQNIFFNPLANKQVTTPPFTVNAIASSGLAVTLSSLTASVCTVTGSTVALLATGTCTIRASQLGSATYAAASNVDQSFTVTLATQTITFSQLANQSLGVVPFVVSATASSGLPVAFSSLTPAVCSVSVNTVTLTAAGTCTVRAVQPGNASYAPAPNIDNTFSVAQFSIVPDSDPLTISGDEASVSGAIQVPQNSGVTINGLVAAVDDTGHFYLDHVPVTSTTTSLTVLVTTPNGQTTSRTIQVTATGTPTPVVLSAQPSSGMAQLAVTFRMKNNTGATITKIEIAVYGDGRYVDATSNFASVGYYTGTYLVAGTYHPSVRLTDSNARIYLQFATVVVQDSSRWDQVLRAMWASMTGALAVNDLATAQNLVSADASAQYGRVFSDLSGQFANIVSSFGPLALVEIGHGYATYAMTRPNGLTTRTFLIYFVQDGDGVWRVDSM